MAAGPPNTNVVILSLEGQHREVWRKSLGEAGYKASFAQDTANCIKLIGSLKPAIFIHDWVALDYMQSTKFEQKLGATTDFAAVRRIVFIEVITPAIAAMAVETGVAKVIAKSDSPGVLVDAIKAVAKADVEVPPEIKAVLDLKASAGKVPQATVDETIEAAIKAHPKDTAVRLEFGNLCIRRSKISEASTLALDLIAENSHNLRAMNLLARAFMKSGDFDSAAKALGKADAMSPMNPERLALLGETFYKKGDINKAKEQFEAALSVDEGNKDAKKGLGVIKLSEGDVSGALDLFQNSVSEEEVAGLFNNAAVASVRQKKFDEALSLYQSALSAVATDRFKPVIYFNMALNYRRMGKLDEALKNLNRALNIDPKMTRALAQRDEISAAIKKKAG